MQYNAALAITGAIKGTFQTNLYGELGLEILKIRRWFRRLCTLLKIKTTGVLNYLFKLISQENIFTIHVQWLLYQYIVIDLIPSNICFSLLDL